MEAADATLLTSLPPDVLAADIVENLRDALAQFEAVADALESEDVVG